MPWAFTGLPVHWGCTGLNWAALGHLGGCFCCPLGWLEGEMCHGAVTCVLGLALAASWVAPPRAAKCRFCPDPPLFCMGSGVEELTLL